MGPVGFKPSLAQTTNGKAYCRLSIGTHAYRGPGRQHETQWHSVHVFGRNAEVAAEYLDKGRSVLIEGHLNLKIEKQDSGERSYQHFITVDRLTLLKGKRTNAEDASEDVNAELARHSERV